MKTYLKKISYATLFLLGLFISSCQDRAEDPINIKEGDDLILKFTLIDQTDPSKQIECKINKETNEIIADVLVGTDVENMVIDCQLANGVEAFTPNGQKIPSNNIFLLRSKTLDADYKYQIRAIQHSPILSFRLCKDQDTLNFVVDDNSRELKVNYRQGVDLTEYKIDYTLADNHQCDVPNGSLLKSVDQPFTFTYERFSVTYSLNLTSQRDPITSDATSLPMDVINEMIEGYKLDLSSGVHGSLQENRLDTISITLEGLFPASTPAKRYFSYYIPANISNNYKMFFELHGAFDAVGSRVSNDLNESLYVYPELRTVADANNTIIIQPIGSIFAPNGDISNSEYGWKSSNRDMLYLDVLAELFKRRMKEERNLNLGANSTFASGTSSGGSMAWGLAYYRSNLFSAVVPRFSSYRTTEDMITNPPAKKIPIMIITGMRDTNVPYAGVLKSAQKWASDIYHISTPPTASSINAFDWGVSGKPPVPQTTRVDFLEYSDNQTIVKTCLFEKASHSQIIRSSVYPLIFSFMIDNASKYNR